MAGIGFALRKLGKRDDLLGVMQGFAHSSLAASGPWLITILALGSIGLLGGQLIHYTDLTIFRLVIIYNFGFSLVFSGPLVMLVTRCLADQIYEKDVSAAPGILLGSLGIVFLTQLPTATFFYFGFVNLPPMARVAAFINLFLINSIWLVSVFLTALKNYRSVTWSFATGMLVATIAATALAPEFSSTGLLIGFNLGLAVVVFSLLARVFVEYPYPIRSLFAFLGKLREYWELALGGFVYNLGIWVDKWIMWAAPEAETLSSRMVSYPDYDSAMFAAYLTIVPSLAVFVYSIETSFFEKYLGFYRAIEEHKEYAKIESAHRSLIQDLGESARNFIVLQLGVSITVVLLSPKIFEALNISFAQIGVFRLGVLGAIFHVLFLFLSIILSYFDLRRVNLLVQLFFLISNAGFTLLSLNLGFTYYGYGYFLASLGTFILTFILTAHYLEELPYQTFVRGNLVAR